MTTDIIEDKDGLYELLGIRNTHVLPNDPDNIILIHVDPANTQEQILAYTQQVKELLPDNKILVLPSTVRIEYFDQRWWTNDGAMITQHLEEKND